MIQGLIYLVMDVYDQRIHVGVARYLRALGGNIELVRPRDNPLGWLEAYGRDGQGILISISMSESLAIAARALKKRQCPAVSLGSANDALRLPAVVVDNYEAGQIAASYFLQLKFRRFAAMCQGVDPGHHTRIAGFTDTLTMHGHPTLVCDDFKPDKGTEGWDEYVLRNIRGAEKPLAVLALDDYVGNSILRHCHLHGIRIPEEVAVLGIGNDHMLCDYATPSMSSIDMNREKLGRTAAELLCRLIGGKKPPAKPVVVPPLGIIERRSTEIVSAEDPRAMVALRHIMDNLNTRLTSKEVARKVGVSFSQLDRIFLKAFGRTVRQERTRLRMQRAKELLATTDVPAKSIAYALGFRTMAHMSRVFAQECNTTIRQFRSDLYARDSGKWDDMLSKPRLISRDEALGTET